MRELAQTGQVVNPLPHVSVWLLCKRLQGSGPRLLPDVGGVLDQDYELIWAFEVLDKQQAIEEELKSQTQTPGGMAELETLRQQLIAQQG